MHGLNGVQHPAEDVDLLHPCHFRQGDDETVRQRTGLRQQLGDEEIQGAQPAAPGRGSQAPDPQSPRTGQIRHSGYGFRGPDRLGVLILIVRGAALVGPEPVLEIDAQILDRLARELGARPFRAAPWRRTHPTMPGNPATTVFHSGSNSADCGEPFGTPAGDDTRPEERHRNVDGVHRSGAGGSGICCCIGFVEIGEIGVPSRQRHFPERTSDHHPAASGLGGDITDEALSFVRHVRAAARRRGR